MGTVFGSRFYVEARPSELEQLVHRVFVNRGFRKSRSMIRLSLSTIDEFFGENEFGPAYHHLMWTPAGDDWLLVLGMDLVDRNPPAVVFPSDIIQLVGRRALDLGFVNDHWWLRYFEQGTLMDELGSPSGYIVDLDDESGSTYRPWQQLAYGDPVSPAWVRARYDADQLLNTPNESVRDVNQTADRANLEPLRAHVFENSDIIKPPFRGRLPALLHERNGTDLLARMQSVLTVEYVLGFSSASIFMDRGSSLIGDELFAQAVHNGLYGVVYFHPGLLSVK